MTDRVLIVERSVDGHYLYYVRLLVLAALERGDDVVLATRAELEGTSEGAFYLGDLFERIGRVTIAEHDLLAVEARARALGATRTVIPDADLWLAALARRGGWRGPGELVLLVLRVSTQPRRTPGVQLLRTGLKRALMLNAIRMPGVHLSVLRSSIWGGRSAFAVTRDPITLSAGPMETAAFADRFGIAPDRTWYAVCGNITDRKNLPMVARAVAAIAADHPVGLLIAGKVEAGQLAAAEPDLRRIARLGRLVVLNRMLTEEELDAAVRLADCVVLAHSNEGPSGLLAKCAAAGTRALTAGARSLRRDARRIPTIAAWVPLDPARIEHALRSTVAPSRPTPVVVPGTEAFTDSLLGRAAEAALRVVWCSPSYGYGDDLVYFEAIFLGLTARFPAMAVPVPRDFAVDRYPALPLRPILRFHRVGRARAYGSSALQVPTAGTLLRLARLRPAVLIAIEFTPLAVLGMAMTRVLPGRRRTLLLLESDPAYRGSPGSPLVHRVKRALTALADVVVANTDLAESYAVERLGVPEHRVVRAAYLTSDPSSGGSGHPPGEVQSILFVNSLTERKGPQQLIRAFAALPAHLRSAAVLDLVGDGEDRASLELLAQELGVSDRTVFHGRVPYGELQPFYRRAAVIVAPSLADYRSLGAIEAAAAGRPAIVSIHDGAHAELARSGAIVVDPLRTESITEALTLLLSDHRLYRERSEQAWAARTAHSPRRIVANLEALILDQKVPTP